MTRRPAPLVVIPAKAGIHASTSTAAARWIPAFAGMTWRGRSYPQSRLLAILAPSLSTLSFAQTTSSATMV